MTEKKALPEDRMLSGLELAVIAIELEKTQKYKNALEEIAYHMNPKKKRTALEVSNEIGIHLDNRLLEYHEAYKQGRHDMMMDLLYGEPDEELMTIRKEIINTWSDETNES